TLFPYTTLFRSCPPACVKSRKTCEACSMTERSPSRAWLACWPSAVPLLSPPFVLLTAPSAAILHADRSRGCHESQRQSLSCAQRAAVHQLLQRADDARRQPDAAAGPRCDGRGVPPFR